MRTFSWHTLPPFYVDYKVSIAFTTDPKLVIFVVLPFMTRPSTYGSVLLCYFATEESDFGSRETETFSNSGGL